jgi:hypothetical protein
MTEVPPPPEYPKGPPLAPPSSPVPSGAARPGGTWPGSPEESPVPERRLPVWVVALAIVAVGALLGGLFAVVTGDSDDDQATPVTPEVTEPPVTLPVPVPSENFEDIVAEIAAFVEAERGLPFLRDVNVELAADAEFEERLLEDFEEDEADLVLSGQVMQAVGLIEPGTDVVEAVRSLLGVGVVGFYDPVSDELVVRGTMATPFVRTVIAHELTHALDDQHFELDRPALDDAADESAFGFTSLVEGNAVRVEEAYRATFTPEEEDEAVAEETALGAGFDPTSIPIALVMSITAPYLHGPALIEALLDEGGQARLDATFGAPPTTSEALLDPPTFVAGQAVVPVPPPVADGVEIDRNVLGALGLAQVLGEITYLLGGIGDLPDSVAGWGGDQYVAWTDGERICLRANFAGDTADDTAEIGDALQSWAVAPPFAVDATVDVAEVVTLTSCG